MSSKLMIVQCQNRKCKWIGIPTFEEFVENDVDYIKATCPECHTFIKVVMRQDVPKKYAIVKKDKTWWNKIKATESELRPAYIIQKELSSLRVDYAACQAENARLKEIVTETTTILRDALECEGIIEYVPEWLKE